MFYSVLGGCQGVARVCMGVECVLGGCQCITRVCLVVVRVLLSVSGPVSCISCNIKKMNVLQEHTCCSSL